MASMKKRSMEGLFNWLLSFLNIPLAEVTPAGKSKRACLQICCDSEMRIAEVQPELCSWLQYDDMIGMSLFNLMPTVVANAQAAIIRELKRSNECESKRSRAVLLDATGVARACRLTVRPHGGSFTVVVEQVQGKLHIPRGFEQFIRQKPGLHLTDTQEAACIMTDLANTTSFAAQASPRQMAELLHKVYVTASSVVEQEALPYVYIHEVVGDSLLLLCNAEFMARFPGHTAAIGIYVASKVQKAVDDMLRSYGDDMYLRVGIALGPLTAGVVDGRSFRVFGSTIHLSQRLESNCPRGQIACCSGFASQLGQQVDPSLVRCSPRTSDLKGYGEVTYSLVDFLGSSFPGHDLTA
ncbi:unnamed protein product [Effrenium voratum]|uniref:Guanylate cyclase domain-containing protein n=1 Tax=Effrenium voratum TaxID=2562239 RepID=A0AA36JAE4_9DINO|nr:unnamed protein product [Effrenium voratum]